MVGYDILNPGRRYQNNEYKKFFVWKWKLKIK